MQYINHNNRVAKIWIDNLASIEEEAQEQIRNILEMPMLFKHLAIMPDVHAGYGVPIGSVMVLERAISPAAVGLDIGCGMAIKKTPFVFEGEYASREYWRNWLGSIKRDIPTGFDTHPSYLLFWDRLTKDNNFDKALYITDKKVSLLKGCSSIWEMAAIQLGTLGGGNHMVEAVRDEEGSIWIMVHSGSRHLGYQIAKYYDAQAKKQHKMWHSPIPKDLNFLPLDSPLFSEYLNDMNYAKKYAALNREVMLETIFQKWGLSLGEYLDVPHNYAAWENHFGHNVIVHRKGAVRLRKGELGIIPGSMGTRSYIVRGLGNEDSFYSCSHGAGRIMSRSKARQTITSSMMQESLKDTFTKPSINYVDEAPQAYKSIDDVIEQQHDILEVVHTFSPIITLKAEGKRK